MIYVPNPKALVYGELNFISTSTPVPQATVSMDSIFDDVSNEILTLFVGSPAPQEISLWDTACRSLLISSEVLN